MDEEKNAFQVLESRFLSSFPLLDPFLIILLPIFLFLVISMPLSSFSPRKGFFSRRSNLLKALEVLRLGFCEPISNGTRSKSISHH